MAELIVLGFKDMTGADRAVELIEKLSIEHLMVVSDWARVIRREDGRTDVRQAMNVTGGGAASGALWGSLIGLIFLMPLGGAIIGGAMGALTGALSDYGINDKFIKELGEKIQPGTSALFVYVVESTGDKVADRFRDLNPEVLQTSLSKEQEERLRAALA